MQYFFLLFSMLFLLFNYKIVKNDLKYKVIPNKLLLFLVLMFPIFIVLTGENDISVIMILFHILISFLISFALYVFRVWCAGDAKYFFVLSLFLFPLGIITFFGNIAFVTLIYLSMYFIYFYTFKNILSPKRVKYLFTSIQYDVKKYWTNKIHISGGKEKKKKLIFAWFKWLNTFLIIFIASRLLKIEITESLFSSKNNFIHSIIIQYPLQGLLGIIFILIIVMYSTLFVCKQLHKIIKIIYGKEACFYRYFYDILVGILAINMLIFIWYEYKNNPYEISNNLFLIGTVYISSYVVIKILWYSYKIAFHSSEVHVKKISELQPGDIIHVSWFKNTFKNKKHLFTLFDTNIGNIRTLGAQDIVTLKKIIRIENTNIQKNQKQESQIEFIQVVSTFPFGIFIFLGFVSSYIYQGNILGNILSFLIKKVWFE